MNLSKYKKVVSSNLANVRGWNTSRKIVVIESDDWGTIRMPSKKTYNQLLAKGIKVDQCAFNKNDTLANDDDFNALFKVLKKFRGINSSVPKITANTIVANPNFDQIKKSNFEEYHFEIFTKTLKSYEGRNDTFNIWKQGLSEGIFIPQFHGREHLNVNRWMKFLKRNSFETRLAFDFKLFGLSTNITKEKRGSYLAALDFDNNEELENGKKILVEGLKIFQKIFNYSSKSFIAPNYVWSNKLNQTLQLNKVKYFQSGRIQVLPTFEKEKQNIRRYIGQTNELDQVYTFRNATFEPSVSPNKDNVGECLKEIQTAFRWKKPAIINSHRLNFIGAINEKNRTQNLQLLEELLSKIMKRWPDVEFMSSDELGDLITATQN